MKIEPTSLYGRPVSIRFIQSIIYGLFVFFLCTQGYAANPQRDVSILVNALPSLDGLPKEKVLALRKAEVEKYGELSLFPKNYIPSSSVFGQVQDRGGWVKDVQFFINNPYLLVLNSSHPFVNVLTPYCNLRSVTYSAGKITEAYRGGTAKQWFSYIYDHYSQNNNIIRLWFANAYDAGFRFAHIDPKKSLNVDTKWNNSPGSIVSDIYAGSEFFHVGHLAKNNLSPRDEKATIKLVRRDTKTVIYIKLWKNRPASLDIAEDFAYVLRMEP